MVFCVAGFALVFLCDTLVMAAAAASRARASPRLAAVRMRLWSGLCVPVMLTVRP